MEWRELFENRDHLRDWLVSVETVDEEQRANWWLGVKVVAERKVNRALSSSMAPDRDALYIVADVIEAAAGRHALSPTDAAIALGHYSWRLAEAGVKADLPEAFRPDSAAKRCLALLPEDRNAVAERAKVWTTLPRGEIHQLRTIKNLLGPMEGVVEYVDDAGLKAEIAAWLPVRAGLP